jgi:hypothetical protein
MRLSDLDGGQYCASLGRSSTRSNLCDFFGKNVKNSEKLARGGSKKSGNETLRIPSSLIMRKAIIFVKISQKIKLFFLDRSLDAAFQWRLACLIRILVK